MIAGLIWKLFGGRFENIQGYLSEKEGKWLFVKSFGLPKKSRVVEIGSFKGKSTFCLALGSIFSKNKVHVIDTFRGNSSDFVKSKSSGEIFKRGFYNEFKNNLSFLNLFGLIVAHKGYSRVIGKSWSEKIDFIFIDGSHNYKDVLADFDNFFPWVKKGGLMALHDVTPAWTGPYDAWHRVISRKLINTGQFENIAYGYKQ